MKLDYSLNLPFYIDSNLRDFYRFEARVFSFSKTGSNRGFIGLGFNSKESINLLLNMFVVFSKDKLN